MALCLTLNQSSFTSFIIEPLNRNENDGKVKLIDPAEISFNDEEFSSFFRSLILAHSFEVYLSTCPLITIEFILSARRPDCWHFVDRTDSSILAKLASLVPHSITFVRPTTELFPFQLTRPLNELLKQEIVDYCIGNSKLSKLICSHDTQRNPMKADKWVIDSLDSCFIHSDPKRQFPECIEDSRLEDFKTLNDWSFTALSRDTDELLRLTYRVFEEFGLLAHFGISESIFKTFLLAVMSNYHENPYHNFCHVVDVLQCCYFLLKEASKGRLPSLLGPTHLMGLLIGCLCHDLGHPSFGNLFMKESEHPLSILFNDTSVLENYHALVLFSILRCPIYDWTGEVGGQRKELRKCVLGCILGTDMSNHFDFINKFRDTFPSLQDMSRDLDSEEKIQLATALIKCSDISNVLRPFSIAKQWGVALLNEFLLQGDYEKLLQLPVGPLNDRKAINTGTAQHRFLTIVAAPLYREVAQKIDGLECFDLWIQENAQNWLNFDESCIKFEK